MNIELLTKANKTITELKEQLVLQQIEHDEEISDIEGVNDSISIIVNSKFKSLITERDALRTELACRVATEAMAKASFNRLAGEVDRLITMLE